MNFFKNLKEYEGMKPGLSRIRKFLKDIGDPQDSFKSIHIAGSNGKGSTAAFISDILICGGYKTALYTSPHLINITERISIDRKNIPNKIFRDLSNEYLDKAVKYKLSFFEYLTSLAFIYFALKKVDIAVIETGLGGRLDATNVIKKPLACLITSITKEHQEILGSSIGKIAFEKAGIIKRNCDVVCGKLPREAEIVVSTKSNSYPYFYGKTFKSANVNIDVAALSQKFDYISKTLKLQKVNMHMLGMHQIINASLAVCVSELLSKKGFVLTETAVRKGLSESFWAGRFDIRELSVKDKHFKLIIDGAHNMQGLNCFINTFKMFGFADQKKTFIFAVMRDKKYKQMIKKIIPFTEKVVLPYINNDRAVDPVNLKSEFLKYMSKNDVLVADSVAQAFSMCEFAGTAVVVGSLYLAGEVLKFIQKYNMKKI
ncbi:MAG: bifunctional folylpolyglutamate synthase/dihydrofolate synthase [Endomicrobium sp.]|jgi:dihydrofolate synthase/folylpolyglutamate synthase|nr:bifunctional folylpolyglutamate synthase/dihydrofolate synthase [Endomicrobium sp.]